MRLTPAQVQDVLRRKRRNNCVAWTCRTRRWAKFLPLGHRNCKMWACSWRTAGRRVRQLQRQANGQTPKELFKFEALALLWLASTLLRQARLHTTIWVRFCRFFALLRGCLVLRVITVPMTSPPASRLIRRKGVRDLPVAASRRIAI
jgi:hypothetical protein